MSPSLATVYSGELHGMDAKLVEVEVDLHVGLHSFTIVGLADKAVTEAKERVSSALKNSGAKPPNRENRKITVNLAPADVHKRGSHYDLPIAIGYLRATRQIGTFDSAHTLFVGELALDGSLRSARGVLSIVLMAKKRGMKKVFVPYENKDEASVVRNIVVIGVHSLAETTAILGGNAGENTVAPVVSLPSLVEPPSGLPSSSYPDFMEIKGQAHAKRAITVAAAGGHNILMTGPPGTGKSLLASAMPGILPSLTESESIEVTQIYSAAGHHPDRLISAPPFRAPHHTASLISLVGGGNPSRPGEITLAHRGILFLDEIAEFPGSALESLRTPLEAGFINVVRVNERLRFPARFLLLAAMNPCPCGFHDDPERACTCSQSEIMQYRKKISGPLADRIDIRIRVPRVPIEELRGKNVANEGREGSASVKKKIKTAQACMRTRPPGVLNGEMSGEDAERYLNPTAGADKLLDTLQRKDISPRAYYRLLKTARTIADLDGADQANESHVAEAFGYRSKDV